MGLHLRLGPGPMARTVCRFDQLDIGPGPKGLWPVWTGPYVRPDRACIQVRYVLLAPFSWSGVIHICRSLFAGPFLQTVRKVRLGPGHRPGTYLTVGKNRLARNVGPGPDSTYYTGPYVRYGPYRRYGTDRRSASTYLHYVLSWLAKACFASLCKLGPDLLAKQASQWTHTSRIEREQLFQGIAADIKIIKITKFE